MELHINDLRELLTAINQTDITELTLKSADFELTVRRSAVTGDRIITTIPAGLSPELVPAAVIPTAMQTVAPVLEAPPAPSAPAPSPMERRWLEIVSPMVGTFYRAPAPDEPPFVDVGDRVRAGQTVCIIEAMKLMNELEAEVAGEIVEILVQNGEPVEYGQVLMRVNPS